MVVLPAPFGPRKPRISPFSTRKRDPVHGRRAAVPLREALDLDHAVSSPRLLSLGRAGPRRSDRGHGRRAGGCRRLQGVPGRKPRRRSTRLRLRGRDSYHSDAVFRVSNRGRGMSGFRWRRAAAAPLCGRSPSGCSRRPTSPADRALPHRRPARALIGAPGASLLLWDRRLETLRGPRALDDGGQPAHAARPERPSRRRGRAGSLSDGQLLETAASGEDGIARAAPRAQRPRRHAGPRPRCRGRKRPLDDAEARLVSLVAARAALALENHAYQQRADRLGATRGARHDGRHARPRLPRADDRDPRLRGDAARGRRGARRGGRRRGRG